MEPDGSVCALVVLSRSVGLVDPSGRWIQDDLEPAEPGTYYFIGGAWTGDGDRFVVGIEHGSVLAWTFDTDQRAPTAADPGIRS